MRLRFSAGHARLLAGLAALTLALSGTSSIAQTAPASTAPATAGKAVAVTTVEGITEYRLANGLRVLLAPDASKPTTTVNITYLVGARHENYGETGMAHLLEHMVFKGTPNRDNIMTELGKRGMQFNGTTSFDRTNYYETFPASEDNLKWAIEMEADRMVNSTIARADLEKEFSVVRNELEMRENNPRITLWKQISHVAYDYHSYGRELIGSRSDIENVKIENLQAFYRKYYQPDNAVLTVAGKFDPAATLKLIEQNFGAIPKPTRTIAPTYTLDAPRDGARELTINRIADTYLLAVLYPTSAGAHPDSAALNALGEILASTPSGRLHTNLVEKKKAVNTSVWTLELAEPGYILFWLELSKDHSLDEARKLMLAQIEGIRKQPITEKELQRAKAGMLSDFDSILNNSQRLAVALSEAISLGDWRMFFLNRDRVEALTVAEVQRVAENYLKESNRTLGQFVPVKAIDRAAIPATPDVSKLVENYKGKAAVAAGEVFDVAPDAIEKRVQRQTLANGAKVILLPKKTRAEAVNGEITLEFGDEKSLFGQAATVEMAASMLLRGAGTRNRADITTELDALKTKLSINAQGQALTVRFETVRASLPKLMPLVRDLLRAPTFPDAEFEQLREQSITAANAQRSEPNAIASVELNRALRPAAKGDLRYTPTFDERIADYKGAKLADVKGWYGSTVSGKNAYFSLVGDFDAKEMEAAAKTLLADWSAKPAFQRAPNPAPVPKADTLKFETPDKANALYLAALPIAMKDDAPDFDTLTVIQEVLGGGPQSRLLLRMRQKDGMSYGAGSQLRSSSFDANTQITLYAIFAPENRARIEAAAKEELQRLVQDGLTQTELDDAKKAIQQERQTRRANDAALSGLLLNQHRSGRTMAFSAQSDARIAALTLAEVNAAVKKLVTPDKLLHVYAGDFEGAAKKAAAKAAAAPAAKP